MKTTQGDHQIIIDFDLHRWIVAILHNAGDLPRLLSAC
jgi:hypothetical protein